MSRQTEYKMPPLTKKDKRILSTLFNSESLLPMSALGPVHVSDSDNGATAEEAQELLPPKISQEIHTASNIIISDSLPPDRHVTSSEELQNYSDVEKEAIYSIEKSCGRGRTRERTSAVSGNTKKSGYKESVSEIDIYNWENLPERKVVEECIQKFEEIIGKQPLYASVHNNLAYAKRLLIRCDLLEITQQDRAEVSSEEAKYSNTIKEKELEVFRLLNRAVQLALPEAQEDEDGIKRYHVSKLQAQVLQQAYSQFASVLLIKAAKIEKHLSNMRLAEEPYESMGVFLESKNFYEEEASHYMLISGAFGDELAKSLASKINPYAKLCGNMVKQSYINQFVGYRK